MTAFNHNRIDHYQANPRGRDLIVGDIHGTFTKLAKQLVEIGFNPAFDRLFSVGDLVDRGPESPLCEQWLDEPWFKAVRGNHEEAAIEWAAGNIDQYRYRSAFGGGWNVDRTMDEARRLAGRLQGMPLAIEMETAQGLVIIIHASAPGPTWAEFKATVTRDLAAAGAWADTAIWGRDESEGWPDVRAVVNGHDPKEAMTQYGNRLLIDTFGWSKSRNKPFTILDARTLRPAEFPSLSWSTP